jgi:outer membrane autotransporter protein
VLEQFYIDGIVSFGWHDYTINRAVRYDLGGATPDINQMFRGDTNANQFSFSVGAGYEFHAAGFTFGPVFHVNYLTLDIDGYREQAENTGAGSGWALEIDSQDVDSLTTILGGEVSYAISTGFGVLLPQFRVEWGHEFADDSRLITARFVNDPQGQAIRFATDRPDRDFVNIGVALSATFQRGIAAFISYETVLALEDVTRHGITLGVRIEL